MYEEELEQLIRDNRHKLEYYATSITGDHDLAEEAVQHGLIEVWKLLHTFDPDKSSLLTWVVRWITRRARSFTESLPWTGRRANHCSLTEVRGKDEVDSTYSEAKEVLAVDVHAAIKALPASLRWVAEESLVKRTPILDLSISSGITKRVLYKWLARARRILRESLKEYK